MTVSEKIQYLVKKKGKLNQLVLYNAEKEKGITFTVYQDKNPIVAIVLHMKNENLLVGANNANYLPNELKNTLQPGTMPDVVWLNKEFEENVKQVVESLFSKEKKENDNFLIASEEKIERFIDSFKNFELVN